MQAIVDELRSLIRAKQVAIIVGAGVSIGASRSPVASWTGLLESGLERCKQFVPSLRQDWINAVRTDISSPDLDDLLSAAEKYVSN